jgi:glutathione S-transferase
MRRWVQRFILDGFGAIEKLLDRFSGPYACGSEPSIADIYLVPAVYIAGRSGVAVAQFPRIAAASAHAAQHPAFAAAHPSKQPGA